MKFDNDNISLPDDEKKLLKQYDTVAQNRLELSKKIDNLSEQLGDKFSNVIRQRRQEYSPLSEDIIEQSSENDKLIDEYYNLSNTLITIENKLRNIAKEK